MIPGRTLHRLAAHICSAKTIERVVEPAIADFQKEYESAGFDSRPRRVRVLVGGYAAILEVMLMCALQGPASTDEERRALRRTFVWAAGILAVTGGLLMALTIATVMMGGAPWPRPIHFAMLIPMTLPIALPIGLTFGLAFGFGGRAVGSRAKRTIVATALVASLVSLGSLATITPLANQAFRQATFIAKGGQGTVMKGAAELTLSELRSHAKAATSRRQVELARQGGWNYHMRVALSFGALVLALFSLAVTARTCGGPRAVIMAGCAVYFLLMFVAESLTFRGVPPMLAAWLANAVFAAATLYLSVVRPPTVRASLSVA